MSKKWIAITVFLILGIFFLYIYAGRKVSMVCNACLSLVTTPILHLQHTVLKPLTTYISLSDNVSMHDKIAHLEQENHTMLQELIALRGTLQFVDDTTELIQYKSRYCHGDYQLAHIILRVFDQCGHYFLVDKGSRHGIQKDMVAVYKNALVGRVEMVYPYWSKVILVTDARCSVAAFCANTHAHGICEGSSDATCMALNHVNHLDAMQKNDYVISSGEGIIFSRGFGIGRVTQYTKEGLFYTVQVKPLISFDSIDYCYLFQKGTE